MLSNTCLQPSSVRKSAVMASGTGPAAAIVSLAAATLSVDEDTMTVCAPARARSAWTSLADATAATSDDRYLIGTLLTRSNLRDLVILQPEVFSMLSSRAVNRPLSKDWITDFVATVTST